MAYLSQDDPELIDDLLLRKEFYWVKKWDHKTEPIIDNIIPRFILDEEISRSGYLKLLGHQQFVQNYLNPHTPYKRLHIKWSTGSGKTLAGLAIAMNFIKNYQIESELGNAEIGSVFIIGFSERAFKNELLRYPEFGFLSKEERIRLDKLKRVASTGSQIDIAKYHDMTTKIKKRFGNRKGNGFFRFFGYKAFVNRIFIADAGVDLNVLSEEQIRIALANGKIKYNEELLKEFKNSIMICDEIHNVYNSAEKNNWGIALQAILDKEESVRCVTLSATPLNNNPAEIVDLLNLLLPVEKRVERSDFFINDKQLKPNALEKIAELSKGRFSFLIDINPKDYPSFINEGESLKEIPYLKFIRCPMSPFHYQTYKTVYTGALSQDSQYLVDFALPNPEDPNGIGIFQTNQIKKLITNADQKWKDKKGIDYVNGKIVGDLLLRKNLVNYSTKYARMLDEIMQVIKNKQGKIFIYHNVVHMSGVLFIEQVLLKNGFIDEFASPTDNTICMHCGLTRKQHSDGGKGDDSGKDDDSSGKDDGSGNNDSSGNNDGSEKGGSGNNDDGKLAEYTGGGYIITPTKNGSLVESTNRYTLPTQIQPQLPQLPQLPQPTQLLPQLPQLPQLPDQLNQLPRNNVTGSAELPANHILTRNGKNYSWDIDSQHMLSIQRKKDKSNKRIYYIESMHRDLFNDENLMNIFMKILDDFSNADILIRVQNALGKKLGEYLLQNGFILQSHEENHSYLIRYAKYPTSPAATDTAATYTAATYTAPTASVAIGGGAFTNKPTNKIEHKPINKKYKKVSSNTLHKFTPARFVMVHSDIEKPQIEHSLERFNSMDNVLGDRFLILVGSKILKESYDIKAIQNEFIMCRPDNIPTLIQIRGRAVRKGSHIGLPKENKIVRIKIFTSCLPVKQTTGLDKGAYKLSYEEEKYKEKIAAFQIIQKIEKVIHENAIDSNINHTKIQQMASNDPLGPIPYKPINNTKFLNEMPISKLNMSTFNIHHAKKEVELIKMIIKRLFIELSSIWEYKDLFNAVKNPPSNYEIEVNTKLFTENNFLIALNHLLWNNNNANYVEPVMYRNSIVGGNGIYKLSTEFEKGNGVVGDWSGSSYVGGYVGGGGDPDPDSISFWVPTGGVEVDGSGVSETGGSGVSETGSSGVSETGSSSVSETVYGSRVGGADVTNTMRSSNKSTATLMSTGALSADVINHLHDPDDKIITLPGGQQSGIVTIPDNNEQYYILFPINYVNNTPDIDIETPYRIIKQEENKTINMNTFIQTKQIDFDYDDKKAIFYRKYVDISIENMENVVCEYGANFHIKFIEECIEYVFRAWTDPTVEKHEMHDFYFKMLYYYDLMSLVMWAYTSKARVFKDYSKYAIPVKASDIKLKAMTKYDNRKDELADISPDDTSDLATSGVINLLKSTFNRTSNIWIPSEFRQQYDETLNKSLALFEGRKKKNKSITKVSADLLPIGHYISKFPRIYIPEKGWDENPTYLQNEIEYKENDILVGFDERSNTGVHIRFKIRKPIHNIKKYKDSRQTEKGTVCKSKSKEYLRDAAKQLGALVPDKVNVEDLCVMIRSKLIRLELKERIKKSNIKYFYFFYEQRPETRSMNE